MKRILRVAIAGALALPLVPLPPAHGQASIAPPRGFFGPGPGDATRGGPGDPGGLPVTDDASWTRWWTFNREPFLAALRTPAAVPLRAAPLGEDPPPLPSYRPDERRIHTEVVPLLRELLADTKDLDLAAATLLALAKIGEPPRELAKAEELSTIASAILPRLEDSNERVRDIAVLALGLLDEPRYTPLLASIAAGDKDGQKALGTRRIDRRTRAFAAVALGGQGYRTRRESHRTSIVGHLLKLAEAEREDTDLLSAAVLGLGWSPLPLVAAPAEDDAPLRGLEEMVARLRALFDDEDADVRGRAQIPVALARLLTPDAATGPESADIVATRARLCDELVARLVEAIGERGGERNASVREGAVQALGIAVDPTTDGVDRTAIEALITLMQSGQEREAGLACIALARIGGRVGAADPEPLKTVARDLRTLLGTQAAEGSVSRQPWATLALGLIDAQGQARGLPAALGSQELLRKRLGHGASPEAVAAAAIALGLAGAKESVEGLVDGLDEGDFRIRGLHATALALLDARGSIPALRAIAADGTYRPYLLRDVATSLALLDDADLVQLLVTKLVVARFSPERIAAVNALAWVQDPGALPALTFLLREKRVSRRRIDDTSRAFAAAALGSLCSRDVLPWNAHLALDLTWSAAPPTLTDRRDGGGVLDLF